MDKTTSSTFPSSMAFDSLSPFLSHSSSSSSSSSPEIVPRRVFLAEFGMKKSHYGSQRKDRVEWRDLSSENWCTKQTDSVIVKDVDIEVEASIGFDSAVLGTKAKAKEDECRRITELRYVSTTCSALPTLFQDAYSNIRADSVAAEITQETYKITKASLEDSEAVIHDHNKKVPLSQDQRLNSILKRKSNGHNHDASGTKTVKQASFQGPTCIKGSHAAKNIENSPGRAPKRVTFDIACKNHQGTKFTAERNIRRKKMQISSETLAALRQLSRFITNVQQERKKKASKTLKSPNIAFASTREEGRAR